MAVLCHVISVQVWAQLERQCLGFLSLLLVTEGYLVPAAA